MKAGDIAYLTEEGVNYLRNYCGFNNIKIGDKIICHSDSQTSPLRTVHYFNVNEILCILRSELFTLEPLENAYEERGRQLGALVDQKEKAYGSSVVRSNEVMKAFLAPYYKEDEGTYEFPEELLMHLQIMIRTIDKFNRIVNNPAQDLMEENTYNDIAGYALIGANVTKR